MNGNLKLEINALNLTHFLAPRKPEIRLPRLGGEQAQMNQILITKTKETRYGPGHILNFEHSSFDRNTVANGSVGTSGS